MGVSCAAHRQLITAHRRDHDAIRAQLAAEFTVAGGILDPHRLDDTTPAWLSVAEELVRRARAESADRAARLYRDQRRAELHNAKPFHPVLASEFGQSQSYASMAMRWIRDYDAQYLRDRSVVSVFTRINVVADGPDGPDTGTAPDFVRRCKTLSGM